MMFFSSSISLLLAAFSFAGDAGENYFIPWNCLAQNVPARGFQLIHVEDDVVSDDELTVTVNLTIIDSVDFSSCFLKWQEEAIQTICQTKGLLNLDQCQKKIDF